MMAYNYLAPLGPRALRRQVRGQLQPYLDSGSRAISGYTDALVRALQPAAGQTQANYLRAEQQQAAVDTSLANRLSGAGQGVQNDLAAQLAQAGQSTAPAQAVGQIGTGASNVGYASGSASLSQLLAQGAAAQQYAGQLPNIARLGGLQQQGQYRQQILSGLPKLLQAAQAQEFQKAIAAQSGLISQAKLTQSANVDAARLQQGQQRLNQGQQSLNLRAQEQATNNLFKQAGLKLRQGQFQIAVQREHRLAKGKAGKSGGFTSSQIAKFRSTAIETVKDWKHGIPASGTTPATAARPKDPRGAFRYLILHGIPPTMADWAVGQVFGKWKGKGDQKAGF